jgi:hypothetical protein
MRMPRERLTLVTPPELDRLPTRWSRRVRTSGIVVGVVVSEWLSIALAHLLGL